MSGTNLIRPVSTASIAGFALIAQFIHGALTRAGWLPRHRAWQWLILLTAGVLIMVHGVMGVAATAAMPSITRVCPM